jgi:hypothetical protein
LKTRLLLYVVALVLLTSCAKDPNAVIASYDHEKFLRDKVQYEPKIGKDYWVQRPVFLCAKPARDPDGECGLLTATTKLEPDGIEQGTFGNPYFHVRLADGRTGYIEVTNFIALTTDIDLEKAAAECKRRGEPRIGMSAKQVLATCWGKPEQVDRRETARGVTERYVYDNGRVVLHNGVVTSVQISGTLR